VILFQKEAFTSWLMHLEKWQIWVKFFHLKLSKGSEDIVGQYVAQKIPVFAVLQLEMTGYVYKDETKIGISKDSFSTPELADFTMKVVDTYTKRGHAIISCDRPCSDHASWKYYGGFRALFISSRNSEEGKNPHAKKATDTKEKLDYVRMKDFVKVAMGFAVELST
jgi:bacterial leucyl aminopeptidase